MRRPQRLILCLLGLLLLAGGAAPAALAAHARDRRTSAHNGHGRAPGHSGDGCGRRGDCPGDTGGTPAGRRAGTPRAQTRPGPAPRPAAAAPDGLRTTAENTAAVIAAVLATPCANTELMPSPENIALARDAVLCLINRERAEHSLSPLVVNPRLESAAEEHCAELIADDYFAHVSPDGETPVDRIRRTGYIPGPTVGYVIGENLAWGTYNLATPRSIVAAWIASPGHLANILESQYTETGIGIVPSVPQAFGGGSPGASYAQEFGVIIR